MSSVDKEKTPARVLDLTEMIEDCKKAVDNSSFGPVMVTIHQPDNIAESKQVVSNVAFPVFQMLLGSLLNKYDSK